MKFINQVTDNGADPIRGISFNGDDTGEDAYASYIGLSGTPEMVKKIRR
jgi:hypothetical protein